MGLQVRQRERQNACFNVTEKCIMVRVTYCMIDYNDNKERDVKSKHLYDIERQLYNIGQTKRQKEYTLVRHREIQIERVNIGKTQRDSDRTLVRQRDRKSKHLYDRERQ